MLRSLLRLALITLFCIPQLHTFTITNKADESLIISLTYLQIGLPVQSCPMDSIRIKHNDSLEFKFPKINKNWSGIIEVTALGLDIGKFLIFYKPQIQQISPDLLPETEAIEKQNNETKSVQTAFLSSRTQKASYNSMFEGPYENVIVLESNDELNSSDIVFTFDPTKSKNYKPIYTSLFKSSNNPCARCIRCCAWILCSDTTPANRHKDYFMHKAYTTGLKKD